jgi:hypothetical protein
VKLERRPLAGRLRYLGEKLMAGDTDRLGVAVALLALADEIDPPFLSPPPEAVSDLCLAPAAGPCLRARCDC